MMEKSGIKTGNAFSISIPPFLKPLLHINGCLKVSFLLVLKIV
jgi:hypothetical protein